MAKISHFKHDHPLIIFNPSPPVSWMHPVFNSEANFKTCYSCDKALPWAEDVYACAVCQNFLLHESCVEFPRQIRHSVLERHTFRLRHINPHPSSLMFCLVCGYHKQEALIYESQMDNGYTLHIKCAFKDMESVVIIDDDLTLDLPFHKHHTLKLHPRISSFDCDASCRLKVKDFSYQCPSCSYSIHRHCAVLPRIKDLPDDHPHPLFLTKQDQNFDKYCEVCWQFFSDDSTEIQRWVYRCYMCRYVVHNNCMTHEKLEEDPVDKIIKRGFDSVHLPVGWESVEMVNQENKFKIKLRLESSEIKFFNHKQHPLILSKGQNSGVNNEDVEEIVCNACTEPILILKPHYYCLKCSYFLHLNCANLPSDLDHESHPHRLILGSRTRFYDNFRCTLCATFSNGIYYFCEHEECGFQIDIRCALLPSLITHSSHEHVLKQMIQPSDMYSCRACNIDIDRCNYYKSESRPFVLHQKCALLPSWMLHKFDKHSLTLRFPPHEYHPKPFDCAQCEKEIDRKYWLYHCQECDTSLHVNCTNRIGEFDSYKCGQKLQINIHPHPLRFVRKAAIDSPCHRCGADIKKDVAFECEDCNFHLCRSCVVAIEP